MPSVLIIEDEAGTRELLKLSLEGGGYRVLAVEDGHAGLAVFESFQPEIVLTDIKMTGMDWIKVLRRLKELNPEVEIIVINGRDQIQLAVQALQVEASDFLNKPVDNSALDAVLARAGKKIEARKKLRDYVKGLESKVKQADFEIKKRYDFEHQLIETSMDGIIANDPDGNIIIFSEGASRITGYTRDEAVGSLNVSQLYAEGEARRIKKIIYGPDCGGPGRLINYEIKLVSKDGRSTPILLSATLMHEDGREIATVGYFKDLTEIKRLEEELVKKTRMAAIGEAMAEMAHGVKNILYGMELGAFMIDKGLAVSDPGKMRKGWQVVRKGIERVTKLSLDMLSYTRKESAPPEPLSLNDLVCDICGSLSMQAQRRGIVLERCLEAHLPSIWGDPEGLHTCLMNLVTNAIEAFPDTSAEGSVVVRTGVGETGRVFVEVSDTGRGMSEELQTQIFKPLFSTKRARGTGLGLAITQKIVGEHGGSIHLNSQPQMGSTFAIFLPVRKPGAGGGN